MKKRILAVLLAVISVLGLVGCSQDKPERAVSELFDAVKKTDMEKLGKILGGNSSEITKQDAFMQLIKKSNETVTYKIGEVSIDSNKATVNVSCTYGDVKPIFGVAFANYMKEVMKVAFSGETPSDEKVNEMLSKEITTALNSTPPTDYSTELKVNCIKVDGKWVIDMSKENKQLADVLTGNLASAFSDMADSMNKSTTK